MFPHTNSQSTVAVNIQSFAIAAVTKSSIMRFLTDKNEQLALESVRDETSTCSTKWALLGCNLYFTLVLGNGSVSKGMLETCKKDPSHACSYVFLSTNLSVRYPFPFILDSLPMRKVGNQMWLEDSVSAEGNAMRVTVKSLTPEICGQTTGDLNSVLQVFPATVKAFPKISQIVLELTSVCRVPVTDALSSGFSPRHLTPRSEASTGVLSYLRFKCSIDNFGPAHLFPSAPGPYNIVYGCFLVLRRRFWLDEWSCFPVHNHAVIIIAAHCDCRQFYLLLSRCHDRSFQHSMRWL
jgi:hypothetical protein